MTVSPENRPGSTKSTAAPAVSSNSSHARHTPAAAAAAGSAYPPARLTEMSNRPYTATNAPTSIESKVQEDARARPASAYTGHGNNAYDRTSSFTGALRPPVIFAQPDSATSQLLEQTSPAQEYPQHDHSFEPAEPARSSSSGRPESAMLFNRPGTVESTLPPRRELPFARTSTPRSADSDTNRPSSRPSSVMMGPPPLPARVTSLRTPSSRAAHPEVELPPLPKPTIISTAQAQPSWMQQQQPPRTPNQDDITPPSAQPQVYEDQENRPMTSSSPNSSPLSYKRASTSVPQSTRPLSSLSSTEQNRRRTESQSPHSTPPTSEEQFRLTVEKEREREREREAPGSENLAAYAMQPADGRRAALNEFLFEQLQDDGFIALLEDMETCWARAGMGGRLRPGEGGER